MKTKRILWQERSNETWLQNFLMKNIITSHILISINKKKRNVMVVTITRTVWRRIVFFLFWKILRVEKIKKSCGCLRFFLGFSRRESHVGKSEISTIFGRFLWFVGKSDSFQIFIILDKFFKTDPILDTLESTEKLVYKKCSTILYFPEFIFSTS